jgi:hypothetical protein
MIDGDVLLRDAASAAKSIPISLHDCIKSDLSRKPKQMIFADVDHEEAQMQDV